MKKFINLKLFLVIGILLIVIPSITYAFDWDNVKSYDKLTNTITIKDSILGIPTTKVSEYTLIENTDQCLIDCDAVGKAILYEDKTKLFSDIKFKDKRENLINVLYNIYLQSEDCVNEIRENYTYSCLNVTNKNLTTSEVCSKTWVNNYTEEVCTTDWKKYKGNELKAGTYIWKIEGKKYKGLSIDWIAFAQGEDFTEWAWWNSNWMYKQEVKITENEGDTLYNYQVRLNVSYDGNMSSDFSDLRFLDDSESTELDYWIEDYTPSSSALVWVEFDEIPASSTTTFYMYYNNSGATTTSNGFDTFIFFDDFEIPNNDVNETYWEFQTSEPSNSVSDSKYISTDTASDQQLCSLIDIPSHTSTHFITNASGSRGGDFGIYSYDGSYSTDFIMFQDDSGNFIVFTRDESGNSGNVDFAITENQYSRITIKRISDNNQSYCQDGNCLINETYNINAEKICARDKVQFDSIFVSNTTQNEPTYTFGSISYSNIEPTIALNIPTNNTASTNNTITFNCSAIDDIEVTNITLYINENVNYSKTFSSTNDTSIKIDRTLNEGSYNWTCKAYDNLDAEGTTDTWFFKIDTQSPTYTLYSPSQNQHNITDTLPINIELNYSVSDSNLDSCWYNTSDNSSITIFTCNTKTAVPFETEGRKTIYFFVNDTLGHENSSSVDFNITYHNYWQDSNYNTAIEGNSITFNLTVNKTNIQTTTAKLIFNNTIYSPTITIPTTNTYYFERTISIPDNYGNSTGINYDWYWNYTIIDIVSEYNTSKNNLKVYDFVIGNCTDYNNLLVNLKIYDENTNTEMDISNRSILVETETNLTKDSFSYKYSNSWINETNVSICVPDYMINSSQNYDLYFTSSVDADDYAIERFYYDGLLINESVLPTTIYLRDLELADSTSFLFSYTNENNLIQKDVVVEVLRKYIGDGEYRIIEREITDENGEVTLHLIEEDAIYKFKIYDNENLIFTSLDYKAYCQALPCSLSLTETGEMTGFDTDFSEIEGTYSWSSSSISREINITFNLNEAGTLNLSVVAFNKTDSSTRIINTDSLTASSGTLSVFVPYAEGNDTYFATLYKINDSGAYWVDSEYIDFQNTFVERAGMDGIVLTGLIILLMGLISISSGIGAIVLIIGVFLLLSQMAFISITGAIILFVIAGIVITLKIMWGVRG